MYYNSQGIQQDYVGSVEAVKWFQNAGNAAEAGFADAQFALVP